MSATAPRVMSRDEAKERLIALNQVIAMAVAAIKTERDILDRFFAESDTIDTIGPIFDPTLWNNTERRVTDALLRPVYEAARKLIVTYDRQCEATRAALAKKGRVDG